MWKKYFVLGMAIAFLMANFSIITYAAEEKKPAVVSNTVSGSDISLENSATLLNSSEILSTTEAVMVTATDSGTYVPYEGAKYSLLYSVTDDGVSIDGIGDYSSIDDLGELLIPAEINGVTVTTIADRAFSNCDGFTGDLIIPDSVVSIGKSAFEGCNGFSNDLIIPRSVTSIGEYAFYEFGGSGGVSCITFLGSETAIGSIDEGTFVYGYKGSTAERYVQEKSFRTFIPLDETPEITEYRVSTSQELLEAIGSYGEGSYRHIILEDGIYEVSNSIALYQLVSMTIEAENPGKAEILSTNLNTPVVSITNCADIEMIGCILGHDAVEAGSCGTGGHVVALDNSLDVTIEKCDLYGCGISGVYCKTGIRNVSLNDCVIRDCMERIAIGGPNADGLRFINCIISGNAYDENCAESYAALSFNGKGSMENCKFLNNHNTQFSSGDFSDKDKPSTIVIENCTFYDNAWDGKTPQAYGICLNGITWQVDESILKIGYPLQLDENTVLFSEAGEVLEYSEAALPWKDCEYDTVQVAEEVVLPGFVTGQCGDNLAWTIYNNILTISGTGKMWDYAYSGQDGIEVAPWIEYRQEFTGLKLKEGITYIGEYAFENCSELKGELVIPDSVTEIGYGAFSGCSGFKGDLIIPENIKSIGGFAFHGCSGFNGELSLAEEITYIGEHAFNGCSNLEGSLNIPDSLTIIEQGTFYNCRGFTGHLMIPDNVTEIGDIAFFQCTGFEGILVIPNGVTDIGAGAFNGCRGLTGTLTIPKSVTYLGRLAFSDCTSFDYIYFRGEAPEDTEFLETVVSGMTILYPNRGSWESVVQTYANFNWEPYEVKTVSTSISGVDVRVAVSMTNEEQKTLFDQIATEEEQAAIEAGDDGTLCLNVTNGENTLTDTEKQTLDRLLTASGFNAVRYLDITLSVCVGNREERLVTQTDTPIKIMIEVPAEFQQTNRVFSVVRLHDGVATILKDLDEVAGTVTIQTDRFSSYTLVYREWQQTYNVLGSVVSFGDESAQATLRLMDSNGLVISEMSVTDNSLEYALTDVPQGTYTLQVSKQNHTSREYTLVVDEETVTQDVELHLIGDVNGDGKINAKDKRIVYNHIDGASLLTEYDLLVGDVNDDGKINAKDKRIIYNHIAGESLLW